MIFVKNTPNSAGVAIYGDYMDFFTLYRALHTIIGNDDDFLPFDAIKDRVLAVCYDLRKAMEGESEIEFVDNGVNKEQKIRESVLAPEKNVYLRINILWPEMLFLMMALNDFVRLYATKMARKSYDIMTDSRTIWDEAIACVRLFQSAVMRCIKETVSDASFHRMMRLLNKNYVWLENYTVHYVDLLNARFIAMNKQKRLKSISVMAKRLTERDGEYAQVRYEVGVMAKKHNVPERDIRVSVDYSDYHDDIDW
jgi:hypothetical protein